MSQKSRMKMFRRLGFLPNTNSVWLCWSVWLGRVLGSGSKMATGLSCPLLTLTVNEFKLK